MPFESSSAPRWHRTSHFSRLEFPSGLPRSELSTGWLLPRKATNYSDWNSRSPSGLSRTEATTGSAKAHPMEPIYTLENTKAAYQLNWSVALFGSNELPSSTEWLPPLQSATAPDGVRILECHRPSSKVVQFLISTCLNCRRPKLFAA